MNKRSFWDFVPPEKRPLEEREESPWSEVLDDLDRRHEENLNSTRRVFARNDSDDNQEN